MNMPVRGGQDKIQGYSIFERETGCNSGKTGFCIVEGKSEGDSDGGKRLCGRAAGGQSRNDF